MKLIKTNKIEFKDKITITIKNSVDMIDIAETLKMPLLDRGNSLYIITKDIIYIYKK
jgi:hypothetical protein